MITIELTTICDKVEEIKDLLELHYIELCTNKEIMKIRPDMTFYQSLEGEGKLLALIVKDEDMVIGYSVNVLTNLVHYADTVFCQNDVLFIHPAYRRTGIGSELIKETEEVAKDRGAQLMIWHSKKDTALERFLSGEGYNIQDILFSKRLN